MNPRERQLPNDGPCQPSRWHGANTTTDRVARAVVLVATIWMGVATSWGLFAIVGNGHEAVVSARSIIAENMNTWGIWGPVRDYTLQKPGPDLYYAHHPWGTFWIIAAFAKVLGRHPYVPRLVSILMSMGIPPLLYGIGRALWGTVPGALAALAYAVLPITLAFGNFPGFEGQLNFACLLTTWGYLRFVDGWRRRWMAVSLAGVLLAVNTDWEACIFLGIVLAVLSVAAFFVSPRWVRRYDVPRFGQWAGMSVFIMVATLAAYLGYFEHIDAIPGLISQEAKRSRGNEFALGAVLLSRAYWIDVCFTPVAVMVGKLALPVFALRLFLMRRVNEVFPLAILVMSVIQYVKFKNGADVHIYWPLPFAPYWALSLGVLAEAAMGAARRLPARIFWGADPRAFVRAAALATFGSLALLILPDGIAGLHYARATGGRFNEKGAPMLQDKDKTQAMEWMSRTMAPGTSVLVHDGLKVVWAQEWAVHRPVRGLKDVAVPLTAPGDSERYFAADLRFLSMAEQRKLFDQFHVVAVGPYVYADRREPRAPAEGYVFEEREPTPLEWYLRSPTEPVRTIVPDEYYTWELRDALGQQPNPFPQAPPRTSEQLRIAHNVAVAQGDDARAKEIEGALVATLDRSVETIFTSGVRLLGQHFARGVAPELSLYFESGGPLDNEYMFVVTSTVLSPRLFSLVEADEKRKQAGLPFWISPRLWKRGYLYAEHCDIRQRPGRERFMGEFGLWKAAAPRTAPRPTAGPPQVPLLLLP